MVPTSSKQVALKIQAALAMPKPTSSVKIHGNTTLSPCLEPREGKMGSSVNSFESLSHDEPVLFVEVVAPLVKTPTSLFPPRSSIFIKSQTNPFSPVNDYLLLDRQVEIDHISNKPKLFFDILTRKKSHQQLEDEEEKKEDNPKRKV